MEYIINNITQIHLNIDSKCHSQLKSNPVRTFVVSNMQQHANKHSTFQAPYFVVYLTIHKFI